MEANVRASPAVHVRRSPPTTYMTVARQAPRPAPGPALARTPHADPHRLGRRRPRVRELARAARTVAVLLDRHGDHRGDPPGRAAGPRLRLDGHPRSRRQDPRRGMGRRTGRRRPAGLGGRHATDRPQGTPPPGARCGSPTPTTCGSPASPPTPAIFRSLPWSCGTANAPGPRTASAPPATAGCRRLLRLARHWPWTQMITGAFDCLRALSAPG